MIDSKLCTGCGVCELLCPTSAVQMVQNEEGFFYPILNEQLCVNCGKCEQCHVITSNKRDVDQAYAVISRNELEIKNSSSGGVFSVLARNILRKNGLVVGCEMSGNKAQHVIINSEKELYRLQGSKYVESEFTHVLPEIKRQLESGKIVLFSGTGCQIAAAKSFLNNNKKIVYFEVLCHGVPSRLLFDMHIKYTEEKNGSKIKTIRFRSKDRAQWSMSYCFKYELENGKKVYVPSCEDAFYTHYIKGNIMRESCYGCKYAGEKRIGDIVGGDYWGVEKFHKGIDSQNGVSFVCICSDTGKRLFDACREQMIIYPTHISYAQEKLHALVSPLNRPAQRDMIYKKACKAGYRAWNKSYRISGLYIEEKAKYLLKKFLPEVIILKASEIYRRIGERNK